MLEAMPSVQAAGSCQACAGLVHVRENSLLPFKWMIMCVCVCVYAQWIH